MSEESESGSVEARETLTRHFATEDLDSALHNHLLGLGSDIGFFEDLGDDRQPCGFELIADLHQQQPVVGHLPDEQEKADQHGVEADFHWLIPDGDELSLLAEMIEKEKLKPVVGSTFPFTEQGLKDAHKLSETHHARGKIVIAIDH